MEISTLSIARTAGSPSSLWGGDPGVSRLVVVVSTIPVTTQGYGFIAYGVDPEHADPEHDTPVFARLVQVGGLGEFFKFLIEGTEPGQSGNLNPFFPDIAPNSVDIITVQPPPPGPKVDVVFSYASAVRSDETLAELGESAPAPTAS